MRGRRPRPLTIAPADLAALWQVARAEFRPWYQVRRARIVLAIAAGAPSRDVASRPQCDEATVWRTCRRYERSGLPGLRDAPLRSGHPREISPPATGPDHRAGLPGARGQGAVHLPLVQSGSGTPSGRRRHRPNDRGADDPPDLAGGGPATASHAGLEDRPPRRPVQGAG